MAADGSSSAWRRRKRAQARLCALVNALLNAALTLVRAGALGGALGVLSGHPLDTLRIRMQQPGAPHGTRARTLASR
jgi:hypothetical protein